jgi:hypothetical protein
MKARFAHQGSQRLCPAHTTHSCRRKIHISIVGVAASVRNHRIEHEQHKGQQKVRWPCESDL